MPIAPPAPRAVEPPFERESPARVTRGSCPGTGGGSDA